MCTGQNKVAEQVRKLWKAGKRNEAKLVCKLAIDGDSVALVELVALGKLMVSMGSYRAALSAASRACKLDNQHVDAWILYAESSLRLRRAGNAVASAKHALQVDAFSVKAWHLYILSLAYTGDATHAEQFVPTVMSQDYRAVHSLCQAAENVRQSITGKPLETENTVQLKRPHIHAMTHRIMGIGLLASGFLAEARRRFDLSLELECDDEISWRNKARAEFLLANAICEKGRNYSKVCQLFEAALRVDYQNKEVADALRELLSISGDRLVGGQTQDDDVRQPVTTFDRERKTVAMRERVLGMYLDALFDRLQQCWSTMPISCNTFFETQKRQLTWAVENISVALPKHGNAECYRQELNRLQSLMRQHLSALQLDLREIRQRQSTEEELSAAYLDDGVKHLQMDCVPQDESQSLASVLVPHLQQWLARGLWREDIMGRSRLFNSRPAVFQVTEFCRRLHESHELRQVISVREARYQRVRGNEVVTETDACTRFLLRCASKSFLLTVSSGVSPGGNN